MSEGYGWIAIESKPLVLVDSTAEIKSRDRHRRRERKGQREKMQLPICDGARAVDLKTRSTGEI